MDNISCNEWIGIVYYYTLKTDKEIKEVMRDTQVPVRLQDIVFKKVKERLDKKLEKVCKKIVNHETKGVNHE